MKTKRFVIAGVVMIVAAMLCNLNWAMNDYGIKRNQLGFQYIGSEYYC